MKRFLAILLVAAMCLTLLPMAVFAQADSYTVTTSSDNGKGASVAFTGGGDVYAAGETATVTVKVPEGYEFNGWYEGKKLVSAEPVYSFVVDGNKELTALTAPATGAKARLTVTADAYTASVTQFEQLGKNIFDVPLNEDVTVKYTGGNSFHFWENEYGKIMNNDAEYKFTFTSKTELDAVTTGSSYVKVVFGTAFNQVLTMQTYNKETVENGDIVLPDDLPMNNGRAVIGWEINGTDYSDAVVGVRTEMAKPGVSYVLATPLYEKIGNYTVREMWKNSKGEDQVIAGPFDCGYGEDVTLGADPTLGTTKVFKQFEINGQPVSYTSEYSFFVTESVDVYMVYDTSAVTGIADLSLKSFDGKPFRMATDENGDAVLLLTEVHALTSDYTVVDHGVLYIDANKVNSAEQAAALLKVENAGKSSVVKMASSVLKNQGEFIASLLTNGSDLKVYAVGYVVYKSGDVVQAPKYTDMVTAEYLAEPVPEQAVAQVGETKYGSFKEALYAALDAGETVKLLANTAYDFTAEDIAYHQAADKNIKVDTNGFEFSYTVPSAELYEAIDKQTENLHSILIMGPWAAVTTTEQGATCKVTADEFGNAVSNTGEGYSIKLLANIPEPYTMSAGQTVKVELNGYSVEFVAPDTTHRVKVEGPDANGITTYTCEGLAAMVAGVKYASLVDALAAANKGQTVVLLADLADQGDLSLKAGVTLNGNGHKLTGASDVYMSAGSTVKNVVFENIHNAASKLSAIYDNQGAENGIYTVTGCTFKDCDWDALQFHPQKGSNYIITDNTFIEEDASVVGQRFVHIQSAKNVDFSATVTGNKMIGNVAQGEIEVYYPAKPDKVALGGNYIENTDGCCILNGSGKNIGEKLLPLMNEALTEELNVVAYMKDAYVVDFFTTVEAAIEAFNAAPAGNYVITIMDGEYEVSPMQVNQAKGKGLTVQPETAQGVTLKLTEGSAVFSIKGANYQNNEFIFKDLVIDVSAIEGNVNVFYGMDQPDWYAAKVTISGCKFIGNYSTENGYDHAVYVSPSKSSNEKIVITGCETVNMSRMVSAYIAKTHLVTDYGLVVKDCHMTGASKYFVNNQATNVPILIENCVVDSMSGDYGIRLNGGSVTIKNSSLTSDYDGTGSAGVFVTRSSLVTINLVGDNTFAINGTAVELYAEKAAVVTLNGEEVNSVDTGYKGKLIPNYVAMIGSKGYETLAEAVAAAEAGQTVEIIVADTYTIPNLSNNITVKGAVDGVVFNCVGSGSIASIPNGATFENVTMNFGVNNYHGFQHAGTINMKNCTLNGLFFSYGDMNFDGCTFNAPGTEASGVGKVEYSMWTYAGNITYTDCVFNGAGKFINVYNESGATKYDVTASGCEFNSTTVNKAAFNVKETCGSKLMNFNVVISDCTCNENFPAVSGNASSALLVLDPLVQVDDRTANSIANTKITVTLGGEQVYPELVAKLNGVGYASIEAAIEAFNAATENGEYELVIKDNEEAYEVKDLIIKQAQGQNDKTVKNLTIKGETDKGVTLKLTGTDNGSIFKIWGGASYKTGTTTIQGLVLDITAPSSKDKVVSAVSTINLNNPSGHDEWYASGVTVDNCKIIGLRDDYHTAINGPSGSGPSGFVLKDSTVENMGYVVQGYFAPSSDYTFGAKIENCELTGEIKCVLNGQQASESAYNIITGTTATDLKHDYAIRMSGGTLEFTGNNFTTDYTNGDLPSDAGVIVMRSKVSSVITDATNVFSAKEGTPAIPELYANGVKVTVKVGDEVVNEAAAGYSGKLIPDPVAMIGTVGYKTLAEGVAAAQAGDVVEIIKAGTYKIPNLPLNITVKGAVDGVVFDCVGSGSIASISNGATFENVTMNFGTATYHGFQHAGTINMNGCTLNGLFFSYGDMNFTECTFNAPGTEYSMWAYGKDLTFTDCVFNGAGKFINVYCESNSVAYNITAEGCTFNSTVVNKAAFNVKETCGSTFLKYNVSISNCTCNENFPSASENSKESLYVISPLVQVDDRKDGNSQINVFLDGVQVYPILKQDAEGNWIIDSLDALLAFAEKVNSGKTFAGETVKLTTDIDLKDVEWTPIGKIGAPFNGTFDGQNYPISNLKASGESCVGLFGYCFNHGNISNVKVVGAEITAEHYAGVILGKGYASVDNCVVEDAKITVVPSLQSDGSYDNGDKAGAIVGQLDEGSSMTITNCKATDVTIEGYRDLGGIVGMANENAKVTGNTAENITITQDLTNGYQSEVPTTVAKIIGRKGAGVTDSSNTPTNVTISKIYNINNAEDLIDFADRVNGNGYTAFNFSGVTVKLNSNINLKRVAWEPIGGSGHAFAGVFDGQNHTISNLTVSAPSYAGLFGLCFPGGTIKNVKINNANVSSNHYAGAVLAQGYASVLNCTVSNSTVTTAPEFVDGKWDNGDKAGAVVGQLCEGSMKLIGNTVTNCTVRGYRDIGGVAGYTNTGVTVSDNTVDGLTLMNDREHNYKNYTTDAEFDVNPIVGECVSGLGENNTYNNVTFKVVLADGLVQIGDTYEISKAAGLVKFAEMVNGGNTFNGKTVKLTADIDLAGTAWTPIGNVSSYSTENSFNGIFDGQNHTISNLTSSSNEPDYACAGLFGSIGGGTVQNVTLANVDITSTHYAGAFVGYASNCGKVINCHVNGGTVTSVPELIGDEYDNGDKVGGIAGYGLGLIDNCSVTGLTIKAHRDLGGIIGATEMTVSNCNVTDTVIIQSGTNGYKTNVDTYHEIIGRDMGATSTDNTFSNVILKTELSDGVQKDGNVYVVTNANGLKYLATLANAGTVELANDIDCGGQTMSTLNIASFDGKGFAIKNAVVDGGFFAESNEELTVKNVNFEGITVNATSADGAGVVASRLRNGTLENVVLTNCTVNGKNYAGAAVGIFECATANNVKAVNCSAKAVKNVGGLFGFASAEGGNVLIKDCTVTGGTVENTATDRHSVGTLIGRAAASAGSFAVNNCSASGVTVKNANPDDTEVRLVGDTAGYTITIDGEAYPAAPETTIVVHEGESAQEVIAAALAEAKPGDVLVLAASETTYGDITLPEKLEGVTLKGEEGVVMDKIDIPANAELKDVTIENVQFALDTDKALIVAASGARLENVTLSNCDIVGNSGNKYRQKVLDCTGISGTITFEDCSFENVGRGLYSSGAFGSDTVLKLDGCNFKNSNSWVCQSNGNAKEIYINGCTFQNCDGIAKLMGTGCEKFTFTNNTILANEGTTDVFHYGHDNSTAKAFSIAAGEIIVSGNKLGTQDWTPDASYGLTLKATV